MTGDRDTVLVANRGEVARRVFRTAARLGMRTVAVHSDADAALPFVREADVAIRIGPAPARESYLDVDRVVAAAVESGADLVHPGYGFLAEDPRLARALAGAGVRFVGPPAEVLASLGDKGRARAIAERAGVPVLPGDAPADQSGDALAESARRTGYPVMVKPLAGGGGIGMHRVERPDQLREALVRARRQAAAAFGDERLLVERALVRPRHVEVQILADARGSVVALGERDCSAQRRHQKVMEECPSPAVDARLRATLEASAIAVAREAGYVNAGTVEFLLDERGEFFFIEVNARLQVEHPVTEAVYGIDLVEQQLRVALGERLEVDPTARGHAFEARLYAEDPAAAFAPSTGRIAYLELPPDARVDSGVERGSTVSRHYDPMLAKIITRGADRATALESLARALLDTTVLGVRTNLPLLRALASHPLVTAGRVDTGLIDREIGSLVTAAPDAPPAALAVAAAAMLDDAARRADPRDPWAALGGWRAGAPPRATVLVGERAADVAGHGPFEVDGRVLARQGADRWTVDGEPAIAVRDGRAFWVSLGGVAYELVIDAPERDVTALASADVAAPMPGVVLEVAAREGQHVRGGELLAIVEAMKMEMRVEAPAPGTVRAVLCAPGQQVARGQRLVELEPDPA